MFNCIYTTSAICNVVTVWYYSEDLAQIRRFNWLADSTPIVCARRRNLSLLHFNCIRAMFGLVKITNRNLMLNSQCEQRVYRERQKLKLFKHWRHMFYKCNKWTNYRKDEANQIKDKLLSNIELYIASFEVTASDQNS